MISLKELNDRIKLSLTPRLKEAGFKGSNGKYIRVRNGIINCIVIQKSRYGEKFTIELGVHYDFLPSMLNKLQDANMYTPYDCEFRKRLSSKNPDLWWEYGKNIQETDIILDEVYSLICLDGETFFNLFEDFPNQFIGFDISSLMDIKKIQEKFGITTEVRFALVLARILTHIGYFERADEFINYGLERCNERTVLQEIFINLRSFRKL